jgi:hypothetical protein
MEEVTELVAQLAGKTEWAAVGAALVAVLVGLVFWKRSGSKRVTPPVPPGSLGWPVLGETLELLKAKRANIAEQFYKTRVAKYGEVHCCQNFTKHMWGLNKQYGSCALRILN